MACAETNGVETTFLSSSSTGHFACAEMMCSLDQHLYRVVRKTRQILLLYCLRRRLKVMNALLAIICLVSTVS